jgi:hypothetical protein
MRGDDQCQKPGCSGPPANTYDGPHGNTLRVCEKHYYQLVTRGRSIATPLGLAIDEMRQEPVDNLETTHTGTQEYLDVVERAKHPNHDILTGGDGEPY